MRKIIPVFLILLLLLCGCGGKEPGQTEGSQPSETFSQEGPEGILEESDTGTAYRLTRMTQLNEDGSESWHREYDYDEKGYLIEERVYSGAGELTYRKANTLDDRGRVASSLITEADGSQYTVEFTYDEADRVILQQSYQNGVITDYGEYSYDEHGNQLIVKAYYGGELAMDYSFSYTYDGSGNILTREEYLDGELISRVAFSYDEKGREVSSVSYDPEGSVMTRTESAWEDSTETVTYSDVDGYVYLTSVTTYDPEGNITFREDQYEGGGATITEYTYEPIEIKK